MKGIIFKPWKAKAISESPIGTEWQTRRLGGLKNINETPNDYDISKHCEAYLAIHRSGGIEVKPRYQVGDVVYIKEAYSTYGWPEIPFYKDELCLDVKRVAWHSPKMMPAWAARTFIQITAVRAERLQEITLEDCWDEGIRVIPSYDRIDAYHRLWDSINPKYPWSKNEWVFVYSFKRVAKPEEQR